MTAAATEAPVQPAAATEAPAQPAAAGKLILATTTSTADSGLLDAILPDFEQRFNADVDGAVQALIVAVFTLLPLLQGEATRRKVTPTAKLAAEQGAREWLAEPIPDDTDMRDIGGE